MNEDQKDEAEALLAIYEDDPNFIQVSDTVYCYKFPCEENDMKSFMLQITWPKDYPESDDAVLDLDSFFNSHITDPEKETLLSMIGAHAEEWAGMAATFSIIGHVTDNVEELREVIRNEKLIEHVERETATPVTATAVKDEGKATKGMTKAQKRRFYDKFGNIDADDKPRGWNWVDVIKHLSKTGVQT